MAASSIDHKFTGRSGSSQEQRVLKALLPANALVDDREIGDLLLFAKRYAAYLNYYNEKNEIEGDWQDLMKADVSVTLADIANTHVALYAAYLKLIYQQVKNAPNEDEQKKHFKTIFDFIFSIALQVDEFLNDLPPEINYKEYFVSTINASLGDPLHRLWQYYQQFAAAGYIDTASEFTLEKPPLQITLAQHFDPADLSESWQKTVTPVQLSVPDPANVSQSIYHLVTHNVFNAQHDAFFKALSNLVAQSKVFLEQTLHNFPSHSPHYALFISFLHLFKKAQAELNNFSDRHLKFYYQDVLQLQVKDAIPDSTHVIVELQKGVQQQKLAKDTLFKAGKDSDGNEIQFYADEETVINRATVKSLQSTFLQQNKISGKNFETLLASPVADSEDGQGEKLVSANGEWFPFGNPAKAQPATMGFAIASHYLYLKEATRTITITLHFAHQPGVTASDLQQAFTIQFTSEKKWIDVPAYTAAVNNGLRTITFTIKLDGDIPALIPFDAKNHQEHYSTDLPVIRFYFVHSSNSYNVYHLLKENTLQKIKIETQVEGAKDVVVQNDEGAVDIAKPFTPFGSQPRVGSAMFVGSKEIFQKKLTTLSLVIDWDEVPDSMLSQLDEALKEYERSLNYIDMKRKFHTVNIAVLEKGSWKEIDASKGIFNEDNLYQEIYNWTRPEHKYARKLTPGDVEHAVVNVSTVNIQPHPYVFAKNENYAHTSVNGFIRLQLNHPDFGHSAYPEALRKAAQKVKVKVTGANTANMTMEVEPASDVPNPPYTPTIKSFSINYKAATEIELHNSNAALFEGKQGQFLHLAPFGFSRISKAFQPQVTLLPFYNNAGELYIGLEDVFPGTTLQLLVQVADGTSNPLKEMTTVEWSNLVNDQWLPFDNESVIDATKNLTRSGIVTLLIPNNDTRHTLFNPSLFWLKATVQKDADAVCKLIVVKAQAIKVTRKLDALKSITYKEPLPAKTISKLVNADAAIKKIEQPFDSSGGRPTEADEHYYTRTSERLRHKQRSISSWDYEKMVLEQFPGIYKVKCIHHTGLITTKVASVNKYSETIPGHVTIVTIPDQRKSTVNNYLKPYTSIGLLSSIKEYLQQHNSPFVKLFVLNPKFEEVQFQFNVVITPPFDETFYVRQLSLDIEQFLCPWAFNDGRDIAFGGKISKSVVLNFIEERPYVDHVTCFKMHHFIDRDTADEKAFYDIEEAKTTTGISILVSYYNPKTETRHLIQPGQNCNC